MKEINKKKKVIPEISEPTEEEVNQTKKMVKDKYDIVVSQSDASKLARLIKEMEWWMKVDKDSASPKPVTEKMVSKFKELVKKVKGKDITESEAYDGARGLLVLVPFKEKQRIADEIRAILVKRRKVLRDPVVSEKARELLRFHYGLELTKNQLEQLIPYLTRKLWYEEGLDESLGKCMDDLLVYADKRKRGKRVNCLKLHNEIRQALDVAVKDLKLAGKEFDPLYREQD